MILFLKLKRRASKISKPGFEIAPNMTNKKQRLESFGEITHFSHFKVSAINRSMTCIAKKWKRCCLCRCCEE